MHFQALRSVVLGKTAPIEDGHDFLFPRSSLAPLLMGSERKASVDGKKQTPFIEALASNFSDAGKWKLSIEISLWGLLRTDLFSVSRCLCGSFFFGIYREERVLFKKGMRPRFQYYIARPDPMTIFFAPCFLLFSVFLLEDC
jgi:hypothetical protein